MTSSSDLSLMRSSPKIEFPRRGRAWPKIAAGRAGAYRPSPPREAGGGGVRGGLAAAFGFSARGSVRGGVGLLRGGRVPGGRDPGGRDAGGRDTGRGGAWDERWDGGATVRYPPSVPS